MQPREKCVGNIILIYNNHHFGRQREMSVTKGFIKFSDFFKTAYDAASTEPFADRFKESSMKGDREEMVKVLMDIPRIDCLKMNESFTGKDDVKASELYEKSCETVAESPVNMHGKDSRISILNKALFAASVTSRFFFEALVDCARYYYDSNAFVRCLKYCEYMLALPANLYDKTAENANEFLECRKACVHLQEECLKKLKAAYSQDKKMRKRSNENQSFPWDSTLLKGPSVTIPVLDGNRHPFLESCSNAVTLRFDEKRGRHLVATRNIKAGTVLIVESPFAFSTDKEALDRNCLHCHVTLKSNDNIKIPCYSCQNVSFCSDKCRGEAWQMYHRFECTVFNAFYENDLEETQQRASHLLLAYRMSVVESFSSRAEKCNNNKDEIPFLNDSFLRYHTAETSKERSKLGINEIYSSRDYRTVLELETHRANMEPNMNLIRAIEAIFLAKCFISVLSKMNVICLKETFISLAVAMLHHLQTVNCNAYEIVENVYDEKIHVWEPRHVGGAIYPSVSLVNHSCYPNVVRHSYPSGMVVVRALRFINKGSEILDCYGPHFLSEGRLARREYLWIKYRFVCACEACTQNWQYPFSEQMNYKCRNCSEIIASFLSNDRDTTAKKCPKCKETNDCKKIRIQFRKSVEKRLNAISKMYEGHYKEALPQLLEHVHFIEKFFAVPNIETIKTQQCIIQCYNQFGCTSQ